MAVSFHLAVPLQHVTVCVSRPSPEVYLRYLWGWVTMANPVFRWLFSTLRGELTKPQVSSCYRTPLTGGSPPTPSQGTHTHTHARRGTCAHVLAKCSHMHDTQRLSLDHNRAVYLPQLARPLYRSFLVFYIYCTISLLYFLSALSYSQISRTRVHIRIS